MRAIQRLHMFSRGWSDIAYSFVVFPSGRAYEGRGWGVAGGHTRGHNTISHAVCAAGNYQAVKPTDKMLVGIVNITKDGIEQGYVPVGGFSGGHRDASGASTACPGQHLHILIDDLNDDITSEDEEDQLLARYSEEQLRKLDKIFNEYDAHQEGIDDYQRGAFSRIRKAGVATEHTHADGLTNRGDMIVFIDRLARWANPTKWTKL